MTLSLDHGLLLAASALSAQGSLFIILTWCLFKDMHFLARKLIMFISIADLMTSALFMASLYRTSSTSTLCYVQAYVLEFGSLSSYLWTGCFAFHLYLLICNRKAEPGRFEKYYHIVSWGLPLLCVGYLLARQLGGHTEVGNADRPWCWIRDRTGNNEHWNRGVIEQFAMYYLPLTLVMVWNLVLYCLLSRSMHDYRMRRVIKRRLLLYLVIFLLCAVWGLVHRVYQLFSDEHRPHPVLSALESFFGPLQGFLNSLVYGVNGRVVNRYAQLVRRHKCCSALLCACCGCSSAAADSQSEPARQPPLGATRRPVLAVPGVDDTAFLDSDSGDDSWTDDEYATATPLVETPPHRHMSAQREVDEAASWLTGPGSASVASDGSLEDM